MNGDGDYLVLEVDDLDVDVLTGIYSEETHLPQPLRISVRATLGRSPSATSSCSDGRPPLRGADL